MCIRERLVAVDSIVVSIPGSYADAVLELIASIIHRKAVAIETIQRLAGKAGWAAGLAPVIWAQVGPLWAACADAAKLLSLIHTSEPTALLCISSAAFCLQTT